MLKEILKFEAESRLLEPGSSLRTSVREKVVGYTEGFLNNINDINAFVADKGKGEAILSSPISEEPITAEDAIDLIYKNVDTPGLNAASGGHLGYIPGGGIYYAALGDYMADITNRFAGLYFATPGAVRLENMLIDWMSSLVGYPSSAAGNLTSGGSIANLIAIVTARDSANVKAKDYERLVVYTSSQAHHSLDKAFRIAGLGEAQKRSIPLDNGFRMIASEVEKAIEEDKKNGLIPWLIVGNAGTTDVGAVDPLEELGNIAKRHNLWYHVDAAYGGFFLLTGYGKNKLKGIEMSDSVVMDPHKGLFLPYGLGTVLVKDRQKLYNSHYYVANYMQDAGKEPEVLSPAELSPELTKHFRGLRLWLPLKLHGLKPFRACLEEKLLLARYFYQEIQKIEGMEVGGEPDLSVLTFRFVPKTADADKFNEMLVDEIKKDGRVFLSSTRLNGEFVIRFAVLSFRTHLETVNQALEVIKEKLELLRYEVGDLRFEK